MILALVDYLRYLKRPGRFGNLGGLSLMARGFRGSLPGPLVDLLRPGDQLFVQTLQSFQSWLIMYLTKSEVSHVAGYAGNRTILHATTAGIVTESLEVLLNEETIVVPCSLPMSEEQRHLFERATARYQGAPYNWRHVVLKGLRILFGRDPLYYRWSFMLDLALALLILDVPFLVFTGRPLLLYVLPLYALSVLICRSYARLRPLNVNQAAVVKPVELLMLLSSIGGAFHQQGAP